MGDLNSQFRCLELHQAIMADGVSRGVPFHNRDLQTLLSRGESEGSSFIYVTLPNFGRAVDQGLIHGTFDCPSGFALVKETRLPKFLNAALKTVFSDQGVLLGEPNVLSIFYLRQFLLINSKLIKQPSEEEKKNSARSFADRQSSLRKVRLPVEDPVLNIAQAVLGKVLKRLDLSSIKPGHGPGVVHEGREADEKWDFTYWPSQANKVYPFYEYGVQSLEHLRTKSNKVLFLDRFLTKVCLVPKDFRGPRLISAEMSALQYLQQGQMRKLMAYMDSNRFMRLSIRLKDQSFNQMAARDSVQNSAATLDLSDASDLVSAPLVWFLLSQVPHVRRYLMRTRAHSAVFDGELIRISAFAPMGSATCFPVETLVFWSLAMATLHVRAYGRSKVTARTLSELGTEVRVFGDDIVIPTDALPLLVSTLLSVGCKPNMSKTCWETPFRESCGTEWFNGSSISITRNKGYTYDGPIHKPSHYPLLCDLQRRLYVGGLRKSAELVRDWATRVAPVALLFHPGSYGLPAFSWQYFGFLNERGTDTELRALGFEPQDFRRTYRTLSSCDSCCFADVGHYDQRLRMRWNRQLHRVEFRLPVFFQKHRKWSPDGYSRLLGRLLSDSSDRVASRNLSVRNAWRPLPAGSWSFMTANRRQ